MSPPPLAKRARRYLRYLLVRGAVALVSLLPVRVASALGARFGALAHRLASGERRKALESLSIAFPERSLAEREALARSCFIHLGRSAFELACVRQLDGRMEELVAWASEDREAMDAAYRRGKGVLFVSGHVGNWELMGRRVSLAGYRCHTIAKAASDERTTALVARFRAQAGIQSVWRGREGAAKQMLKVLRSGGVLGLIVDQDTQVQSLFVPLFGTLAATPRAPADLALRTGAAVVVGFCQREASGGYRLRTEEVPIPRSGDGEADALALTAELSARTEAAIRRAPEQWVWMHRRWKTRP